MTTGESPSSNTALLVGAIELAMLDRLRARFVDDKGVFTLFVIDFPFLAHIHCVPPLNLNLVETTGLLIGQVSQSGNQSKIPPHANHALMRTLAGARPKELGLTEVLSRYIFDRRWSGKLPKLMLSTQINEASDLEDGIRSGLMREWQDPQPSISSVVDGLEKIAKENAGNVKAFVEAAVTHAEDTLPALYGTYSQTRQYLRFSDIKPASVSEPQERPVMFADAVMEVQQYLDEVDAPGENAAASRFEEILGNWKSAIDVIFPNDEGSRLARRSSDAKTLALLEYLNLRLLEDKKNCRLVFLTSHGALFDAAGLRFGCMTERERRRRPNHGSFTDRDRSRYCAWLLAEEPGVSTAPILDPRVLMTSRDFIEYAVPPTQQASNKENVQAITEWLPLFFNGQEHDTALLARSYLHFQGVTKVRDAPLLTVEKFGESQFTTLISSWDKYLRTISTAHGISKSVSREGIRDLLIMVVKGQPGLVLEEIRRRMATLLSAWLPAVGGATFSQLQVSLRQTKSQPHKIPSRSMPPLLMPAFEKIQASLTGLLGNAAPMATRTKTDLAWLSEPTAENLGIDQAWCEGGEFRIQYIQALGLAYGFAIEENWSAAFRLASIAHDVVKLAPRGYTDPRDVRLLSGREAAFLSSFTARRRFASVPIELAASTRGERYVRDIESALRREEPIFEKNQWIEKFEAHKARIGGEHLSWQVFRLLSRHALDSLHETRRSLLLFDEDTMGLEGDLQRTADTAIKLCSFFGEPHQAPNGNDHAAYAFAMYYLARQSWLGVLQLHLFMEIPSELNSVSIKSNLLNALLQLRKIERFRPANCTWTGLEYDMLCAATAVTRSEHFLQYPPTPETGSLIQGGAPTISTSTVQAGFHIGLNQWRRNRVSDILTISKDEAPEIAG